MSLPAAAVELSVVVESAAAFFFFFFVVVLESVWLGSVVDCAWTAKVVTPKNIAMNNAQYRRGFRFMVFSVALAYPGRLFRVMPTVSAGWECGLAAWRRIREAFSIECAHDVEETWGSQGKEG